jgi:hypothetical protein
MVDKITFQLNQNHHKSFASMLEIANMYIDRYFDPYYETELIKRVDVENFDLSTIYINNTYYDFEDHYIIEINLDNCLDETHGKVLLDEMIKDYKKEKSGQLLLIRLSFDLKK